jgi:hypothetical protein
VRLDSSRTAAATRRERDNRLRALRAVGDKRLRALRHVVSLLRLGIPIGLVTCSLSLASSPNSESWARTVGYEPFERTPARRQHTAVELYALVGEECVDQLDGQTRTDSVGCEPFKRWRGAPEAQSGFRCCWWNPLALNPPPSTLHPQPSTLHPPPSTLHPPPSTLNPQPSTPSTLNPQPSTLKPQPSTHNHQPSTLNPQPSVAGLQGLASLAQADRKDRVNRQDRANTVSERRTAQPSGGVAGGGGVGAAGGTVSESKVAGRAGAAAEVSPGSHPDEYS